MIFLEFTYRFEMFAPKYGNIGFPEKKFNRANKRKYKKNLKIITVSHMGKYPCNIEDAENLLTSK